MSQDRTSALRELLDSRIAVLDGAWGTMFQNAKLSPDDYQDPRLANHPKDVTGDPDLLNITKPEVVLDIHRQYLAAGADITTTNTFTATSIGQADYGLESMVREMNLEAARIARQAADEAFEQTGVKRYVAGSVGPLNVTLSLSPKVEDPAFRAVTFEQVYASYAEQIEALRDGGVDLLLIETIFDTLNAKAASAAAQDVAPDLPVWFSITIVDASGRTLSGQTVEAFWRSIEHANPLVVGVNCALGPPRCVPTWPISPGWPAPTPPATRTPACPTRSASTSRSRARPATWSAFAADGLVNVSAAAAVPPPRTSRRSPRG